MSERFASTRLNITNPNNLKNGSLERKLIRKSALTSKQEEELVTRIILLAEIGHSLKIKRRQVVCVWEAKQIPKNFNKEKGIAGKALFKLYKQRHPKLVLRKAKSMIPPRAQKIRANLQHKREQ